MHGPSRTEHCEPCELENIQAIEPGGDQRRLNIETELVQLFARDQRLPGSANLPNLNLLDLPPRQQIRNMSLQQCAKRIVNNECPLFVFAPQATGEYRITPRASSAPPKPRLHVVR